jgi:hypothetical protein
MLCHQQTRQNAAQGDNLRGVRFLGLAKMPTGHFCSVRHLLDPQCRRYRRPREGDKGHRVPSHRVAIHARPLAIAWPHSGRRSLRDAARATARSRGSRSAGAITAEGPALRSRRRWVDKGRLCQSRSSSSHQVQRQSEPLRPPEPTRSPIFRVGCTQIGQTPRLTTRPARSAPGSAASTTG